MFLCKREQDRRMRREAWSSTTPNPCQEKVPGHLLHTGKTCSHNGVMGYPRYSILEMHLGKFLDLGNFRAGKSTSRFKYAPAHSYRDCKEIEELRRFCHEEADKARRSRIEELSMNQERSPTVVNQDLRETQEFAEQGKPFDR